jgi:hypothetical protein
VEASRSRPSNIRELLHVCAVRLIDTVHRLELSRPPPDGVDFHTLLFLLSASCLSLAVAPDFAAALSAAYDDCGSLGSAVASNLVKSLFLPTATVAPGQPLWCDRATDAGLFDPNRAFVVLALLLFRWVGCDCFHFPTAAFVSSVANALLTFGSARGRALHARFELLELSLRLMLCIGADFSGVSDEAIFFRPLTAPLDRRYGEFEARTYVMPLFLHFLILQEERFTRLAGAQMLENALHLADFVSATEYTPVMLRVLAHMVCLPGLARVLHSECRAYASAGPTHLGPWIVVAAQVAVRVAASWANADNDAVLAVILARVLSETDAVPDGTLRQIVAVYTGTKDTAAFLSFVNIVRRMIGVGQQVRSLAAVLAAPDFLQRLLEAQRESEQLREVVAWAKAQTKRCKRIREKLAIEDLRVTLAQPENRVAPAVEVGEETLVAYNIR